MVADSLSKCSSLRPNNKPYDLANRKLSVTTITSYSGNGKKLKRTLDCFHAFCYVIGILLGSGLLISPSYVARETSSMGEAIIIWIVCGVVCLIGALCFCELASAIHKTGGEYIFIKEIYGDVGSFVTIWTQMLVIYPSGFAILAETVGGYCIAPFYDLTTDAGFWLMKSVAVLTMVISFAINCVSMSFVAKSQTGFTIVQILTILFIMALGIWKALDGNTQYYETMFKNDRKFSPKALGLALYNSLWAYDGWGYICILTEEVKNPSRNLPLSVMTGIPFVIICYVLVNLAFMSYLSHKEIAKSSMIATAFVNKVLGHNAAIAISLAAAVSCFSGNNASLCVVARSLLSAAREGQLPQPLSYIHIDRRTPIPSLFLEFFLSVVWIVSVRSGLQTFLVYFSFAVWLTYGMALFGVIVLRIRRPNLHRPYKVWIVSPIFMSLVSLYLVIAPFAKRPLESSICLAFMLTALPVYFIFVYKHDSLPKFIITFKERCYVMLLQYTNLVPCTFGEKDVTPASSACEDSDTTP